MDCTLHGGQLGADTNPMMSATDLAPIDIPEAFKSPEGIGLDWQHPMQPSFAMAVSMQAMVDAINGDDTASPDFARALEVERVQEAIRISQAERRWIRLDEVT